jgi:hypothetical protein
LSEQEDENPPEPGKKEHIPQGVPNDVEYFGKVLTKLHIPYNDQDVQKEYSHINVVFKQIPLQSFVNLLALGVLNQRTRRNLA